MLTPYFAFENEIWADRSGARSQLCRFERFLNEPVVPRGPKGSHDEYALEGSNVLWTGERFMMWYTGRRPPPENVWHMENQLSQALAYSDDGIHWEKPALNQVDMPNGGAPNNMLANVSRNVYGCGVLKVGNEYVMAHFHPRELKIEEGQTTFSMFRSKDGIHWKGNRRGVIKEQHFEGSSALYHFAGKYWVSGQGKSPYYYMPDGSECGRVMIVYSSDDLKTWSRTREPAFAYPIPKYFPDAGVQNHQGASVEDRGRVAIGFMGQFWPGGFSETVRSTIGLIYSHDGLKWSEPYAAEPMLLPAEKGWDSGMLMQCQGFYSRGNHSYYWYAGADGGNLWTSRVAIGMCRLRRDGFALLTPKDGKRCRLETMHIKSGSGAQVVYLNCEIARGAKIRIEALDAATGKALANGVVTRSGVLTQGLQLPVGRAGRKIILQFEIAGKSSLYSFYIGPRVDVETYLAEWR
jgi:hypothetical protein